MLIIRTITREYVYKIAKYANLNELCSLCEDSLLESAKISNNGHGKGFFLSFFHVFLRVKNVQGLILFNERPGQISTFVFSVLLIVTSSFFDAGKSIKKTAENKDAL